MSTILSIETRPGMAGESRITATVDNGIATTKETFVGNTYGAPGPVVYFWADQQIFVTEPARFGERFDEAWVRAFFAD